MLLFCGEFTHITYIVINLSKGNELLFEVNIDTFMIDIYNQAE